MTKTKFTFAGWFCAPLVPMCNVCMCSYSINLRIRLCCFHVVHITSRSRVLSLSRVMAAPAWPEHEICPIDERPLLQGAALRPFGVNYLQGGESYFRVPPMVRRLQALGNDAGVAIRSPRVFCCTAGDFVHRRFARLFFFVSACVHSYVSLRLEGFIS